MTNLPTLDLDDVIDGLRIGLEAAYAASPALQAEFAKGEDYVAFEMNQPAKQNLIRKCRGHIEDAENAAAVEAAGRT